MNFKQVGLSVSALTLVATSVMAANVQQNFNGNLVEAPELAQMQTQQYMVTFNKDAKGITSEIARNADELQLLNEDVLNAKAAAAVIENVGGKFLRSIDKRRIAVATLTEKQAKALANRRGVSVEVDPKRYILAQSTPWGISRVQATSLTQSNKTIREVCIIDTGYDMGHEDLPTNASGQANNGSVGAWTNDGHGHGTHVAGTVAGLDNSVGVVGVYPGVDLHIVKIFNDQGNWTSASNIVTAIQQCVDAGADVVSMSLGGSGSSTSERNAMADFVNNDGVMLIAAAGNDGNSSMSYPASYDAVMSVGATDSSNNIASFSQYNSQVEISAPGVAINSSLPNDTYASWNGTSMATPHVSGVAALVWSYHTGCTNEQIRAALNATAEDRGAAGRDNFFGYGIVKALDAKNHLDGGCGGGGGGGGGDSQTHTGLSGGSNGWDDYTMTVPASASVFTASMSGGTGDADLYTRFGSFPTTSSYDCRPYTSGNNETCTHNNPSAGTWYVSIRGYTSYSGITLTYGWE